ncbi:zinc finger protein 665-like isoform X2 [Dreissena polymorpha]|uniref:zinc finger protein 665-like isoform X2 n=1 Tax=Dreissena polymorpha TaxID=45954 RepID=UPI0022653A23|nr:zinc finger protein 665-like isoform X2 [Dreissena polymorpha]
MGSIMMHVCIAETLLPHSHNALEYICGECGVAYTTICQLHDHLLSHGMGGSYIFDHMLLTAFTRLDTACVGVQTDESQVGYFQIANFKKKYLKRVNKGSDEVEHTDIKMDYQCGDYINELNGTKRKAGMGNRQGETSKNDTSNYLSKQPKHMASHSEAKQITTTENNSLNEKEITCTLVKDNDIMLATKNENIACASDDGFVNESNTDSSTPHVADDHRNSERYLKKENVGNDACDDQYNSLGQHFTVSIVKIGSSWEKGLANNTGTVTVSGTCFLPSEWVNDKAEHRIINHSERDQGPGTEMAQNSMSEIVTKSCGLVKWSRISSGRKDLTHGNNEDDRKEKNNTVNMKEEHKCLGKIQINKPRSDLLCETCGIQISTRQNLEGHVNNHRKYQPYICERCGFKFKSNKMLKRHQDYVHSEKLYDCYKCSQSFQNRRMYDSHIYKFHKEKNKQKFICSECNKSFASKHWLGNHQAIHDGEKKFKCCHCDKKFKLKCYLQIHEKSHLRAFKCDQCWRTFSHNSALIRHKKIHTNTKDFVCHLCERGFIQKTPYWVHMEKHHDLSRDQLLAQFARKQ